MGNTLLDSTYANKGAKFMPKNRICPTIGVHGSADDDGISLFRGSLSNDQIIFVLIDGS